jgi:hypothetical protein
MSSHLEGPRLPELNDLMARAERYRCKAEECRVNAETATSADARRTYLDMARTWDQLAEEAEMLHKRRTAKPSN